MKIRCSVGKGTMEDGECLACALKNVLPPCGMVQTLVRLVIRASERQVPEEIAHRLSRHVDLGLAQQALPDVIGWRRR